MQELHNKTHINTQNISYLVRMVFAEHRPIVFAVLRFSRIEVALVLYVILDRLLWAEESGREEAYR